MPSSSRSICTHIQVSSMRVETFTVQCFECMKWRIIPAKQQYEMIGEKILEQPWVCEDA
jgi:hypothetical protein